MTFTEFLRNFISLCGILALAAYSLATLPVWGVLLAIILAGTPALLPLAVIGNLKQAHRLAMLDDASWIKSRLSGPLLRLIIWSVAVLCLCAFALPQLALWNLNAWIILVAAGPVFLIVHTFLGQRVANHVDTAFKEIQPIRVSGRVTGLILTVFAVGLSLALPSDNSQIWQPPQATPSELVSDWLTLAKFIEHIQSYTLAQISKQPFWQFMIALFLGPGAVAFLGAILATCAAIPRAEFRRALGRATLDTPAPFVDRSTTAWTSGIVTVLALFFALPLLGMAETKLKGLPTHKRAASIVDVASQKVRVLVEIVNGQAVRPGTIETLQLEAQDTIRKLERDERASMRAEIDRAANGMIDNVDLFLDNYYSLTGEYKRIILMMAGDLETELEKDLARILARGGPSSGLERLFKAYSSNQSIEEIVQRSDDIIEANSVNVQEDTVLVVTRECGTAPCMDIAAAISEIRRETSDRLQKSGLAGASGGIVAGLIVKKIITKGTLKIAAKTMVKAIASKTAASGTGATLGAVVGGFLGSIVPGAGTSIGAVAGGALGGVLIGISVEALLIELEETLGRPQFKAEIVDVINAWRSEALAVLEPV